MTSKEVAMKSPMNVIADIWYTKAHESVDCVPTILQDKLWRQVWAQIGSSVWTQVQAKVHVEVCTTLRVSN